MRKQTEIDAIQHIPTRQITPGHNDRTVFDPVELQELAASIEANGLAQPITVRGIGRQCPRCKHLTEEMLCNCRPGQAPTVVFTLHQIVAGERRFRAVTTILHWDKIPCIVRELTDQQTADIMLIENISRKDLDPIDEARAYRQRQLQFSYPPADISKRCGVSAERVRKRLKLLSVRDDILHLVRSGQFPLGHAEILGKLDRNRQLIAARPLIDGLKIAFRDFQTLVDNLYQQQIQECLFDLAALEKPEELHGPIEIIQPEYPIAVDLPDPVLDVKSTTGDIILDYIHMLTEKGFEREAAVVGRLLKRLSASNYVRINPVRLNI